GDVSRTMNEKGLTEPALTFASSPASGAAFVNLIDEGVINSRLAKQLFPRVWEGEVLTREIVEREGLAQVSDPAEIGRFVDEVVAANAKTVDEIRKGKENALQFLKGQVMKASRGKANPTLVEELLREAIRNHRD
ncbi:MAG: Asp-tRNA(Asn)/Glu-tRNA(Gln) amidotransferase GatCAB subunit B, partial [Candidatus Eremiobacteraeota bacterium]|nr:Asp-tRNA(Asn)/Glu-tRNA(Gln) amidotransferase GatCAB subunit B [Candidatus Eremiobacteraeota bacterium]